MRPTQELVDEHNGIKRMLAVLDRMAGRLEAGEPVDVENLRESLGFIQGFADRCHHAKEEDLLFPAMEATGVPRDSGPIAVMLQEHVQGRALVRNMNEALGRYADGDKGAAEDLARNMRSYTALLAAHIDKEDNVLYPIAEARLAADTKAELAEGFERVEREVVGPGKHEAYHRLLDRLSDTYL